MKKVLFYGVGTAIITPFDKDYNVDYKSLDKIIDYQISGGVDALIVCGTTGEASTLSYQERIKILKFVREKVKDKLPIIVGVGSNNFSVTKKLMQDAKKYADAYLIVTPYYNKTTQRGLEILYTNYASISTLPIFIYNVPSRTGVNVLPQTYNNLKNVENIVAVKEADLDMGKFIKSISLAGDSLSFYSGNDDLTLCAMGMGAKGVISVASNLIPNEMCNVCHSFIDGDIVTARDNFLSVLPLLNNLFLEVNPIPIKYAMSKLGLCENVLRLPLVPLSVENCKVLDEILPSFL